jgi:undecaprenyl-diphosphatase
MPTTIMQFNVRIKNDVLKRCVASAITAFIVFMVIGRLISGVHWFTDIVGGALLSTGLVMLYREIIRLVNRRISFLQADNVRKVFLN